MKAVNHGIPSPWSKEGCGSPPVARDPEKEKDPWSENSSCKFMDCKSGKEADEPRRCKLMKFGKDECGKEGWHGDYGTPSGLPQTGMNRCAIRGSVDITFWYRPPEGVDCISK